ncbi:substance-K receptor-like [Exaiptasia diaphana]|uniref:G-protein coupled receptors family 1 profile domain-containing protein n=1 Tax=Exaiptasia diaphana TaxID=2652724 RepID=A0A913XUW8_EXADI|nr:substance-K receptor-like [Exaiptasia diaphana]
MKKPTNYFILNMAISDLVVPTMSHSRELVLLYTKSKYDTEWLVGGTIGTILCKLVPFFHDVTTAVSILSLILITIDRFIAVVYPMKHYIMSKTECKVLIFATWLLGMSLHAVYLYTFEVRKVNGVHVCVPGYDKKFGAKFINNYFLSLFSILTVTPTIVMTIAYTIIIISLKRQSSHLGDSFSDRQKRQRAKKEKKIIQLAIVIIITFIILWAPFNALVYLRLFVYNDVMPNPCFLKPFRFIALFCAYANAAINPCIVFILCQVFRQGLRKMLSKNSKIDIVKNQSGGQQLANQREMRNMAHENNI